MGSLEALAPVAEANVPAASATFDFEDALAGVSSLVTEPDETQSVSQRPEEFEALRNQRDQFAAELRQLQNRWEAARVETAAAREKLTQLEEHSRMTEATTLALQQERDEALAQMRLLEAAKDDAETLDQRVSELTRLVDGITAERDELQRQLEQSLAQPAAMPISAADPMELAAWEQRYATLENQYDTLLDERDRLLAEHAEMVAITQEAAHLAEEIQQLRDTNQSLELERNEVVQRQEANDRQAADRYTSLEEQYDSLLAERDRLLTEQAASLDEGERERLELRLETLQAEHQQAVDALEERRQAAAELALELASARE